MVGGDGGGWRAGTAMRSGVDAGKAEADLRHVWQWGTRRSQGATRAGARKGVGGGRRERSGEGGAETRRRSRIAGCKGEVRAEGVGLRTRTGTCADAGGGRD